MDDDWMMTGMLLFLGGLIIRQLMSVRQQLSRRPLEAVKHPSTGR